MTEENKSICIEINNSSNNPQSEVKLSSSFLKDYNSFCNKKNSETGVNKSYEISNHNSFQINNQIINENYIKDIILEKEKLKQKYDALKLDNEKLKAENLEIKKKYEDGLKEIEKIKNQQLDILNNEENEIRNYSSFSERNNFSDLCLYKKKSSSNLHNSSSFLLNDEEKQIVKNAKLNYSTKLSSTNERKLQLSKINSFNSSKKQNFDKYKIQKLEEERKKKIKIRSKINIKTFRKKFGFQDMKKYPDSLILNVFKENACDENKTYEFLIEDCK